PPAGSTIHTTYSYIAQAPATIALDFSDLTACNVTDIHGTVSLTVANFVSLSGSFDFQEYQQTGSDPIMAIGATNVSAVVGTADTNLTISGVSLGMLIQGGNYALKSENGMVALNGVPGLSISAS